MKRRPGPGPRSIGSKGEPVTGEFTSQFFFHEKQLARVYAAKPYRSFEGLDTANADDGIYSERLADGSMAGSHLTLDLRPDPATGGHVADFTILLTDASLAGRRELGRPPGRGGFGPPDGGPGGPDDDRPFWMW